MFVLPSAGLDVVGAGESVAGEDAAVQLHAGRGAGRGARRVAVRNVDAVRGCRRERVMSVVIALQRISFCAIRRFRKSPFRSCSEPVLVSTTSLPRHDITQVSSLPPRATRLRSPGHQLAFPDISHPGCYSHTHHQRRVLSLNEIEPSTADRATALRSRTRLHRHHSTHPPGPTTQPAPLPDPIALAVPLLDESPAHCPAFSANGAPQSAPQLGFGGQGNRQREGLAMLGLRQGCSYEHRRDSIVQ
ncbi:hypothetical protein AcV7_006100 [Taiwanofungus camphoratus]|nr:hypothetical protein AcV7_006100 [Antrodia cinnamomea]